MQKRATWSGLERARAVWQQWNQEHPDRWAPWEWLEEALLAHRAWRLAVGRGRNLRGTARARFHEFSQRLPQELIHLAMCRRYQGSQ